MHARGYLAFVATIAAGLAFAATLRTPTVSREAILQYASNTVDPKTVTDTHDGGFIVAGSLGSAGWAAKTDTNGKLLWTYRANAPPEHYPTFAGEFICAAVMGDRTTYLAGVAPRPGPTPGYDSALLVHLDANGQLISEVSVAPTPRTERGIARFRDCVRSGDNLAIVGDIISFTRPAAAHQQPISEELFWFLLLDAAGNVLHEKQIPISSELTGYAGEMDPLLDMGNSGFVLSATDNRITDVVSIAPDGRVKATKLLPGSLHLVRPVVSDSVIQLFGQLDQTSQLITVDEELEEIRRAQGDHPRDFLARLAYRRPDQALVLFGSEVHSVGAHFTSHIVLVDAELWTEQGIDLPLSRPPLIDKGDIWAAASVGRSDQFVVARSVARRPNSWASLWNGGGTAAIAPDFERGAALDFIAFK